MSIGGQFCVPSTTMGIYQGFNRYSSSMYNNVYNNFFGGYSSMFTQGQAINIGGCYSPIPIQQNNSGLYLQQLMGMFLPLLQNLLVKQPAAATPATVDQTSVEVTPKTETPTTVTQDTTEITPQTTCENSKVYGDPIYNLTGKNGKKVYFQHKGKSGHTYNIFQGDGYEVDGKYGNLGNPVKPIVSTKIKAGADTIEYKATNAKNGKTRLNGEVLKDGSYTLKDGTVLDIKKGKAVINSREGDAKISMSYYIDGIRVTPTGDFGNMGGIMGTAIDQSRKLSEKEANTYDVTEDPNKKI